MNKLIEENFVLEETNLWRCKECGGTYENENECLNHLKDSNLLNDETMKELTGETDEEYGKLFQEGENDFAEKTKQNLIKHLKKYWDINNNLIQPSSNEILIDANGCLGLKSKSKRAKELINNFEASNNKIIPEIDYFIKEGFAQSGYSSEYLVWICKLFNLIDKNLTIKIKLKEDTPACFENEDFLVMLSPRVGCE